MKHRSISVSLAVGLVALTGACTSQPSTRAVTLDMIEALPNVSQDVKDCMRKVVNEMKKDELNTIAKSDELFTSTAPEDASPEMQAFIDDLAACNDAG